MASIGKFLKKTFVPESSIKDPLKWAESTFVPEASVQNPIKWVEETFAPGESVKDPLKWAASTFLPDKLDPLKDEPSSAAAILSQAPPVPTLEEARTKVATAVDLKRRRGRAASILSDRPDDPLGYTGGGMLATRVLGGA